MSPRSRPVRICTGCGERKEKTEMVRIVADPSGLLIPDLKNNLPSRGAYVCPDAMCIDKASTGRLRASLKAGKGSGAGSKGLQEAVAAGYRRRIISLLGQAKKSGRYISGTNQFEGFVQFGVVGQRGLPVSKIFLEKINYRLDRYVKGAMADLVIIERPGNHFCNFRRNVIQKPFIV